MTVVYLKPIQCISSILQLKKNQKKKTPRVNLLLKGGTELIVQFLILSSYCSVWVKGLAWQSGKPWGDSHTGCVCTRVLVGVGSDEQYLAGKGCPA